MRPTGSDLPEPWRTTATVRPTKRAQIREGVLLALASIVMLSVAVGPIMILLT